MLELPCADEDGCLSSDGASLVYEALYWRAADFKARRQGTGLLDTSFQPYNGQAQATKPC